MRTIVKSIVKPSEKSKKSGVFKKSEKKTRLTHICSCYDDHNEGNCENGTCNIQKRMRDRLNACCCWFAASFFRFSISFTGEMVMYLIVISYTKTFFDVFIFTHFFMSLFSHFCLNDCCCIFQFSNCAVFLSLFSNKNLIKPMQWYSFRILMIGTI